ncbi:putative 2-dehydropantoate 2-reductase [Desulfuromonas acetoxidans]|uniref:2-dehydropantoate 2-reductase n=1 Tax=Desulfuromonas acetoxidans (strain DSM 684 / 11070) TaxID=281689 RepID=Q1K1V7_DESA6|nr:putative 2-dehydropantoate 2-reductase [Desulfuromonas acetoxidans]EAT16682.1 2-dehydropantoate 2-reductase [Desulfuromonas acetoxidans DSM 684]MBF0645820.1 putative 2-dehydropantoate 2-reductase [Desulfuromonas acetoxidans]NVD24792.1 putative 2-dehydropantoate 2-reductase [Desulfuromonas acetoxidans]NVE16837.1 putative 2-dehydropantoate 2-reductase [Desulfuromonas acetoxidans]
MTIAMIGSGALGLYYGARLQQAGEDVHFLLRSDYDAICNKGLTVHSCDGDFYLESLQGYRNAHEMPKADLVIVGLKTFANQHLKELITPLLSEQTAILTLQNGLGNEEQLAELFGRERILGGVAFICSNRGEPGKVHHLSQGAIRLGEFSAGLTARAEQLSAMFNRAQVPCQAVEDLKKIRWEKLVWNIPFNGLCALTDKTTDLLLAHPPTRELISELMDEVANGANAQDLTSPIDGKAFGAHMIEITEGMDDYHPSMMIDRQQGRPLELEAIYAIPLKQAAQRGIELPRIAMLYSLLSVTEK